MKIFNAIKALSALAAVALAVPAASAFSTSQYAASSVLASGNWVKVKVDQNAVYQISYDQLRDMGFSNPENVTVWGYGGAFYWNHAFSTSDPEDLTQLYILNDQNRQRILFYGEAGVAAKILSSETSPESVHANRFSDYGYYFLTDGQAAKAADYIPVKSYSSQITTHAVVDFQEFNEYNPGEGGAFFFTKDLLTTPDRRFTFTLNDPDPTQKAHLSYVGALRTNASRPTFAVTCPSDITVATGVNNNADQVSAGSIYYSRASGYQKFYPRSEGSNDYTFKIYPSSTTNCTFAGIHYLYMLYYRPNRLADDSWRAMNFRSLSSLSRVVVSGTGSDISHYAVWNVTDVTDIRPHSITATDDADGFSFSPDMAYTSSAYPTMYTVVVDTDGDNFPTPQLVGPVPNQNLHGEANPDFLIICNSYTKDAAERLAQAHRDYQGLTVVVATQDQIFNEFSSGTPSAHAYRRAAKMYFDRDNSKFRYLLLFGAGSFDNCGHTLPTDDYLLTYETEDWGTANCASTNYCADAYFGMLSDIFSLSTLYKTKTDIAVGRIPATDPKDIESSVDKAIYYLANPPKLPNRHRAIFFADDGDYNKHELQAEYISDLLIKKNHPEVTVTKAYNNLYPWDGTKAREARNMIKNCLSQGISYICYIGHGQPKGFTAEWIWDLDQVANTTYMEPPVWMLGTCDAFSFDRQDNGIGEKLIYKENGGSIATIGACRSVSADSNQQVDSLMAKYYFDATPGTSIGEAWKYARNHVIGNNNYSDQINTLCYNFGGDPALPIYASGYKVVATEINGKDVTDDTPAQNAILQPLASNVVKGYIAATDGTKDTSFNGQVTLSVFDAPQYLTTVIKDGSGSSPRQVYMDEYLLTEETTTVTNGEFEIQFTVPLADRPDQTTRISLFAARDQDLDYASGYYSYVTIGQYDSSQAISNPSAPEITEMYLDDTSFIDGQEVGTDVMCYATIKPGISGINNASAAIGGVTALVLDGSTSYSTVRLALMSQADGTYTLTYPITGLVDGRHTLALKVADNFGNLATRTIAFQVVNREVTSTLVAHNNIVRESIEIDIQHDFSDTPTGRLVIEDMHGNMVYTRDNVTFPFTWDLRDSNGNDVADGQYQAYATLNAGLRYSSTPRHSITVLH